MIPKPVKNQCSTCWAPGTAAFASAQQEEQAYPRDQCHSQRYNQSADNSVGVVWEVALNEFQVV
jgi:hypothetical protein